ncbi:uncharacterized protein LOC133732069 isoform X1 [Rosa rugosa]|uniref:uncharacterized protein LOC133732069 isoform X1 n=1 Tax=Rosa rugosa TaxID=74645 RepID=UPI002B408BA9|nr:uncharacterized protein LOC133732069 isoform X1 [Rosa rugosa]
MAVDTNFASSLLQNLKLEDPLLPPTTWESIPSESGHFHLPTSTSPSLYHASTVSEASLVRLAMNALQGVESSLISVQKLSAAFRSDPADRTFHQVPSLWSRSSSTRALGNVLHPIGCSGLLVFLLGKFVDYFTNLNVEGQNEAPAKQCAPYSLVNHAFAVAVGKVVEGYMCALDTLYASVGVRRRSSSGSPSAVGCLNSVLHSELTLLELYLHTKELRTQIESLTNICNLYQFSDCFSASSFDELLTKAKAEFCNFHRGGDLLTYLYTQLQVADPAHRPVLKFLFLRTCEPYFGFIRSWIFKAEISDPYEEFLVEYVHSPNPSVEAGISIDFPLATIRERDGVPVPCFLKDFLLPLFRAGQQLQVLAKLLELCTFVAPKNHTYESFLPCWSGFSSNCPSYASPLSFSKGNIEAMVLSRECYYKRMQDQLQNLLTELEFRFQQVISQDTLPVLLDNSGRRSTIPVLVPLDDSFIAPSTDDEGESNVVADDLDSDELSTRDNVCYTADAYESSECSSSTISEEQNVFEQMTEFPNHIVGEEQKYLSALSFSMSIPVDTLQKPHGSADSCHIDKISRTCERKDAFGHSHHKGILTSQISDVQFSDCLSDKDWPERDYFENQSVIDIECKEGLKSRPTDFASKVNERIMGSLKEGSSYFRKRIMDSNALIEEAFGKVEPQKASYTSDTFALQQWKVNYHNNFLSMNPMLTKNNFLHLTSRPGERCKTDLGDSLAYFDFSHIKDPCKVFPVKVPVGLMDSGASTTSVRSDHHLKQCSAEADVLIGRTIVSDSLPSSDSKGHTKGDATLTNVSGGSCWESLLGRFSDTVINRVEDHRESLAATFDIPLDFIIDTCLLQEIMLQYKYVSKLTIKLLEEGFDLQEHLLALRRYHFMELADWADLFIMSLWHHKWSITQADHRLSEIQSFLESSVQRSSCERDHNKDRLFVYLKGHDAVPLSASAIGVHSFNFLGLGYRVDWPISIVLTPGALKIYAEIFSFLIQVKLALFSLTEVWCQLKDLVQLISRNNHSEQHEKEVSHFNAMVKMRHQVNHFVSTLQQYVESQLSHVSWCRFLYSLQHKVKDMMDLQSVHMAYLSDSLHICFLSDETRPIACIIESILQCALDFRSCLTGEVWNAGTGQGNLIARHSGINISQVLSIKQTFDKNMKELHLCYLRSPKHGEFGLSHFWEYLNYNKYYSHAASKAL